MTPGEARPATKQMDSRPARESSKQGCPEMKKGTKGPPQHIVGPACSLARPECSSSSSALKRQCTMQASRILVLAANAMELRPSLAHKAV